MQPLEAELNDVSEQVRKASEDVAVLQEAVLLAQQQKTDKQVLIEAAARALPSDTLINLEDKMPSAVSDVFIKDKDMLPSDTLPSDVLPSDMLPSETLPSDMLVNLEDAAPSENPSLSLSVETMNTRENILIPEKLDSPLANSHTPKPSSQYLSQELF